MNHLVSAERFGGRQIDRDGLIWPGETVGENTEGILDFYVGKNSSIPMMMAYYPGSSRDLESYATQRENLRFMSDIGHREDKLYIPGKTELENFPDNYFE